MGASTPALLRNMATQLPPLDHPRPWSPSLLKRLRSPWLITLLLLAGMTGGGLTLYRTLSLPQAGQSQLLTARVEQKSLPITFAANGTVKPARTINLSPKTAGYLQQLLVQEGDRVQAGQIVAYMDNSNLQGQLTQARAQLAQQEANLAKLLNGNRPQDIAQATAQLQEAQARLQQLQVGNRPEDIAQTQAQLASAQANLRQAEDDLQRNQSLLAEGAISQQTVIQKRSTRDAAQAAVNQAQAALRLQQRGSRSEEIAQAQALVEQRRQALSLLQAGSRAEDIQVARAQVEAARGGLQTLQTQLEDTVIKAPFTGVVTKKYADPGSFVTPTTAGSGAEGAASNSILTLAATNQVVAYLDEAKIARIKVGQPVNITADAYPDRRFSGKVSQIAAQATTTQNVTSFEVKVDLEPTAQQLLRAGMNVEAEFQVGQLNRAILVPSAAIVCQPNGTTGVYVLGADQQPQFRPIQIGLTLGNQTEARRGLQGSEQVLISFPPGMEPKSDVRGPFPGLGRNRR